MSKRSDRVAACTLCRPGLMLNNGREHGNYYSILGLYNIRVMEKKIEIIAYWGMALHCAWILCFQRSNLRRGAIGKAAPVGDG